MSAKIEILMSIKTLFSAATSPVIFLTFLVHKNYLCGHEKCHLASKNTCVSVQNQPESEIVMTKRNKKTFSLFLAEDIARIIQQSKQHFEPINHITITALKV